MPTLNRFSIPPYDRPRFYAERFVYSRDGLASAGIVVASGEFSFWGALIEGMDLPFAGWRVDASEAFFARGRWTVVGELFHEHLRV